jgi:hypothetical protein
VHVAVLVSAAASAAAEALAAAPLLVIATTSVAALGVRAVKARFEVPHDVVSSEDIRDVAWI